MKKIEAIIRSSQFDKVRESLANIGVNFFTFFEVKGFGHQKGQEVHYRGAVYDIGYIARMKLEIVVPAQKAEEVMQCIIDAAYTGEMGDGKVFVSTIENAMSIRTKGKGTDAV